MSDMAYAEAGVCDHCDDYGRPPQPGTWQVDPYVGELYDEEEQEPSDWSWWCDECYSDRHVEV